MAVTKLPPPLPPVDPMPLPGTFAGGAVPGVVVPPLVPSPILGGRSAAPPVGLALPPVQLPPRPLTALPMDAAARQSRAQALGYRMEPAHRVYHGAGQLFTGFDPGRVGENKSWGGLGQTRAGRREPPAHRGAAWVAFDPTAAAEFAQIAQTNLGRGQGSAQIYPLVYRSQRTAVLTLDGDESGAQVDATIIDAFDRGYDAVRIKNYTTPSGETGKETLVVKNASQLRSPWANFDPAMQDSIDLLGKASRNARPGTTANRKP